MDFPLFSEQIISLQYTQRRGENLSTAIKLTPTIATRLIFLFKLLIPIYKIQQNEYTTYPKISAKRDFPPIFALILKYVVCGFWPFLKFEYIFFDRFI